VFSFICICGKAAWIASTSTLQLGDRISRRFSLVFPRKVISLSSFRLRQCLRFKSSNTGKEPDRDPILEKDTFVFDRSRTLSFSPNLLRSSMMLESVRFKHHSRFNSSKEGRVVARDPISEKDTPVQLRFKTVRVFQALLRKATSPKSVRFLQRARFRISKAGRELVRHPILEKDTTVPVRCRPLSFPPTLLRTP